MADWGVYPPDRDVKYAPDSAGSLVYFPGTKFRTDAVGNRERASRNCGPYFAFPPGRLEPIDNDGDGLFGEDPYGDLDGD